MHTLRGGALSLAVFLFTTAVLTSGAIAEKCKTTCARNTRMDFYGFDILKGTLNIDVGVCQTLNECELTENTTCPKMCEPRSTEIRSFSRRSGPFTVEVVKSCYRNKHHCPETSCSRKPRYVYYFPDSKFQTRLDVGKCIGGCNSLDSQECVSVRNKSVAIDGPNGHITVDIILECSCQNASCYRMDYFESYSANIAENTNNTTRRAEKLINVGKCIGECTGIYSPARCFPSDDDCQLRIPKRKTYCVPITGAITTFEDIHGSYRTVQRVESCGCSTG